MVHSHGGGRTFIKSNRLLSAISFFLLLLLLPSLGPGCLMNQFDFLLSLPRAALVSNDLPREAAGGGNGPQEEEHTGPFAAFLCPGRSRRAKGSASQTRAGNPASAKGAP